ncbi:MAG TPA: hypothetical protein VF680_07715 [Allosphingosinicella sp.]
MSHRNKAQRRAHAHAEMPPPNPQAGTDPLPWEGDPPPEAVLDQGGRRVRHDAFTARRKHQFLRALAKSGCIDDAARQTGVDRRTIYRHQEKEPEFLEHCRIAVRVSAVPVELTAWQRAVEGVEQEFACGGQVHIRRRYDSGLLRLLLQASNPKKFGPRPGFTRKRIMKFERKQMERDVRAENQRKLPKLADVQGSILSKLGSMADQRAREKLAAGWREHEGHWIPPGWGPLPGHGPDDAGAGRVEGADTPRETM